MSYLDKSLREIHEALKENKVTSKELIEESLKRAKELQDDYNSFVTIIEDLKETEITDSILSGIPYAAKDNLSTKGVLTTASSNILKDYIPVVEKLSFNAYGIPQRIESLSLNFGLSMIVTNEL